MCRKKKKITDEELFEKYPIQDIKQVLVVRDDLKMGKGKIGAQCGHATLGAFKRAFQMSRASRYWNKAIEHWTHIGQKKICVKVSSEQDLIDVQKKASELGIPHYLVADAGHTQIAAGSLTVCGLGPLAHHNSNVYAGQVTWL